MLNIFPIQFLAPFAYMILRIGIGFVLFVLGVRHLRNRFTLRDAFTFRFFPYGLFFTWYLAIVEMVVGIMYLLGLFTQIAAIITILMSLKFLIMHRKFSHPLVPSRLTYFFILIVSVSLLITGGGVLGFDLPI